MVLHLANACVNLGGMALAVSTWKNVLEKVAVAMDVESASPVNATADQAMGVQPA